jgi:hypothetical protein
LLTTVGGGVSTYTVTGLVWSTLYYAEVRHKRNGQFSAYSNEVSGTTNIADALTINSAVWSRIDASNEKIALTFTAPPTGNTVQILTSTTIGGVYSIVGETAANGTSFDYDVDVAGTAETAVFFKVRAKNGVALGTLSAPVRCWAGLLSTPVVESYAPLGFGSQWELVWSNTMGGSATTDIDRQDSSLGGYPNAWVSAFTAQSGTVKNLTQVCGPSFVAVRVRHRLVAFAVTDFSEWYEVIDISGC